MRLRLGHRRSGRRNRADDGVSWTIGLEALSIVVATGIAIACSYRPIIVWWLMVACSAVNLVRFWARRKAARAELPQSSDTWTPHAALVHEGRCFRAWFAQHNLMWTIIGFGVSLLLWHWFGATAAALVVMSALMACGTFAGLGTVIGARAGRLGLCWREPSPTPSFRSIRRFIREAGAIMILKNRTADASASDWARGGRFHELFLVVDQLRHTPDDTRLFATLRNNEPGARTALARKERVDRAVALAPLFVAGLLFATIVVPPFAGDAPLPPLWQILTSTGQTLTALARDSSDSAEQAYSSDAASSKSASADRARSPEKNDQPDAGSQGRNPGDQAPGQTSRDSSGKRSESASRESQPGAGQSASNDRRDDGASGASSDTAANRSTRNDGQRAGDIASEGKGAPKPGSGSGSGAGNNAKDSESSRSVGVSRGDRGARGGGKGFGTQGSAPQRAANPVDLPQLPQNPGDVIEVTLPPLTGVSQPREGGENQDDEKQKANATPNTLRYQPQLDSTRPPNDQVARDPAQRWPNWVFLLLRR
jgi:hypothetical protein